MHTALVNFDKNPLYPFLPVVRKFRVMRQYLRKRLHLPPCERLVKMRHQDHLAHTVLPDLLDKFRKSIGRCKIDHRVRLAAVTVTTRDDRKTERIRHFHDLFIFRPSAETIDLKGVDPFAMLFNKRIEQYLMSFLA